MRTYSQFRKMLAQLPDTAEFAWFTTFNISISFVERYLLPALFNEDPQRFKTVQDFEDLNRLLTSIDSFKPDYRFYHDFRTLKQENKRTVCSIIPIDPTNINFKVRATGIFHPKVAFVWAKGIGYIITGSANLTVSGWGRNREAIFCEQIKDRDNAIKILEFYDGLTAHNVPDKLWAWADSLPGGCEWNFISSYRNENISTFIQAGTGNLLIWSPYFSTSLNKLLKKNGWLNQYESIKLIPDSSKEGKVRITAEDLSMLQESDVISFHHDKGFLADRDKYLLQHAKVFVNEEFIGIGSWNMTDAALTCNSSSCANIEAGVVIRANKLKDFEKQLIAAVDDFMPSSISELNKEKENVLNPWRGLIELVLDWQTFKITIKECSAFFISSKIEIILPGNRCRPVEDFAGEGLDIIGYETEYLQQRIFKVREIETKEIVFEGIFSEINIQERHAEGYSNLQDFIQSWISDDYFKSGDGQVLTGKFNGTEEVDHSGLALLEELSSKYFYYPLFMMFHKIKISLDDTESVSNKIAHLAATGITSSRSLHRFILLFKELLLNENISQVFKWFVEQETVQCVSKFNLLKEKFAPSLPSINYSISIIDNELHKNERAFKKYITYINRNYISSI